MKNSDDQKFRRLALATWIESNGGMSKILQERGLTTNIRSQVSAILRGYSFGKVAARSIESKLGIPDGWLDLTDVSKYSNGSSTSRSLTVISTDSSDEPIGASSKSLNLSRISFCISNYPIEKLSENYQSLQTYRGTKNLCRVDETPCLITDIHVSLSWLNKHVPKLTNIQNLCVITSPENSISPPYCMGDPMLIDIGVKNVKTNGIYLFRLNGMNFIKRLIRTAHSELRIMHSEELYDSWLVTPNMELKIFGEIIKIWRSN